MRRAPAAEVDELDNVLLTTAGRCIRFPVDDVRLFKGRDSTGVRGIRLDKGDEVISMAILRHVEATPGERAAYLKQALAMRRAQGAEVAEGAAGAPTSRPRKARRQRRAEPGALRRARRARAVRAHGVGARLRQALVVLRVPDLRPRRQRHHRHDRQRAQRPSGGLLPGRGERPDHARHRRRQADPLPGRRRAHRRPQHAGRAHLQDRGRARRSSPSSASPRTAMAMPQPRTANGGEEPGA